MATRHWYLMGSLISLERLALAAITGTVLGVVLGTALFIIMIELDDGKRWDFTWA